MYIALLFSCEKDTPPAPETAISPTLESNSSPNQEKESTEKPPEINPTFHTQHFENNPKEYYGGEKILRIGSEPLSDKFFQGGGVYFDPHTAITNTELQLADALFPKLIGMSPKGSPIPMLAKSWKIQKSQGGFTYIFTLGDYTWGNGEQITAEQVKTSYLRVMSPFIKNPHAAEIALSIRGGADLYSLDKNSPPQTVSEQENYVYINAKDSRTLHITTTSLSTNLLQALAHPIATLLPLNNVDTNARLEMFDLMPDTWVRKGAYSPTAVSNDKISLEASDVFDIKPWLENIIFIFEPSLSTQIEMFNNGGLDWVTLPYALLPPDILNEEYKDEANSAAQNLHKIENAAKIFLELPDQSAFKHAFFNDDDIKNVSGDFSQLSTHQLFSKADSDVMKIFMYTLIENMKIYLINYTQNYISEALDNMLPTENIFFPNIPLPPQELLQTEENKALKNVQAPSPEQQLPEELLANDPLQDIQQAETVNDTPAQDSSEEKKSTFEKNIAYHQRIINFLNKYRKQSPVIKVAYNNHILKNHAEVIVNYLKEQGINARIIAILPHDTPHAEEYDVAIRLSQASSHTRIGIYSTLWWLWVARNAVAINTFGNFYELTMELYNIKNIHQHVDVLHKINNDVIQYARYTPLWNLPRYELINTTQYPWWTRQTFFHPLLPQWR